MQASEKSTTRRPRRLHRSPEREWRGLGFGFGGEPVNKREEAPPPAWRPTQAKTKDDPQIPMTGGTYPLSTGIGAPYLEITSGQPYPWERDRRMLDLRDITSKSPV